MRWAALRMGLVLVFGLALLTVALNVRATHMRYRLGVVMHRQDEQQALIEARHSACKTAANTLALAKWTGRNGLDLAILNHAAVEPLPLDPAASPRRKAPVTPVALGSP